MLELHWDKPLFGGEWHELSSVDLSKQIEDEHTGVYIIFYQDPGDKKYVAVRLGSGILKKRLQEHKGNDEIMAYKLAGQGGELHVSWAQISEDQMQGVEKYLAQKLRPVIGERFPEEVKAVQVNLPWES